MGKKKKGRRRAAGRRGRRTGRKAGAVQQGFGIRWPGSKPDLKGALALVEQYADRPFSLKEIVVEIQQHAHIRNPDPKDHIRSLLSEAPDLARLAGDRYIPGRVLFQNAAFYISPTGAELAEGVLVPGHRFYPFMRSEVRPDEVQLFTGAGDRLPQREIARPFIDLMIYHTLLGMPEMLALCEVDEEALAAGPEATVEMEVYDLRAFYEAHPFSEGDLILARVLDYTTGAFELVPAGAQMRLTLRKDTVERDALLEAYLPELMEEFGPQPPLYLLRDAYARLFDERVDLSKPASPFGPFLGQSEHIEMGSYYGRPCLVPKGEDPEAYYGPPMGSVYDGRCETLEDLFNKGNLSIGLPYVRACILDDLDFHRMGKEAVVERMFEGRAIFQWNEADRTFFQAEFDALWEDVQKRRGVLSPNRQVRTLRSRILAQCDAHLAFLRELDQLGILPDELPMDEMAEMAALDGLCQSLLEALETPPRGSELQVVTRQLPEMEARWEALREAVEEVLEADAFGEEDGEVWEEEDVEEVEGPVTAYLFKVKFRHAKRIWRKIEVAEQQTLHHLHLAILDAIGWDEDHLYSFFMSNRAWDRVTEYASPHAEEEARNAGRARIGDLGLKPKQKFLYLFDYGDCHEFEVEVVGVNPDAPAGRYPRLVESRGEAPEQYPDW